MQVLVAEKYGFCPGVKSAITLAKKTLTKEKKVYSLGPIIHNESVVEELAQDGLHTIQSLDDISDGTVLIRSHGATLEQLEKIQEKGLRIVDATCILVKRVQKIATELHEQDYR